MAEELADYDRFWKNLPSRSVPAYDLAASHVIGHKDVRLDWSKFRLAFDGDPQVNVYKNTHALPRALLVPARFIRTLSSLRVKRCDCHVLWRVCGKT